MTASSLTIELVLPFNFTQGIVFFNSLVSQNEQQRCLTSEPIRRVNRISGQDGHTAEAGSSCYALVWRTPGRTPCPAS